MGCARYLANGRQNLYFRYRIEAAAELFHTDKVRHILVSGDNSIDTYDESTDMMEALVEKGVPADRIVRDYAGFSTLDSVVRAKAVFLRRPFNCRLTSHFTSNEQSTSAQPTTLI